MPSARGPGPRDKLGTEHSGSQYTHRGAHTGPDGSAGTWPHLLVASELANLKLQSGLCSRVWGTR